MEPILKIPSKLEVAPPPKCGLGEWVIPLRLLRLLEHLAVLKIDWIEAVFQNLGGQQDPVALCEQEVCLRPWQVCLELVLVP